MGLAALRHNELARELTELLAVVSSITESVLGHSPTDTFRMEVLGELAGKF
jgi:hypothetical protein